jgi:DNA mismatch repair protein MutH
MMHKNIFVSWLETLLKNKAHHVLWVQRKGEYMISMIEKTNGGSYAGFLDPNEGIPEF